MAGNDLIMRPKVDAASLRRSAQQMEREYSNSGIRAARTTAQFTQQALTQAYRLAARAGASAMQSAFTVGLQAVGVTIMSMLRDIDDTLDRVEGRASSIGDLANRAGALGVDSSNLAILDLVAGGQGVSTGNLDRLLGTFAEQIATNDQLANFAQLAENDGLENAFVQFLQSANTREQLVEHGFTGNSATIAAMLSQELEGATGWQQLLSDYGNGEVNLAQLSAAIEGGLVGNAINDQTGAIMQLREIIQAGNISEQTYQSVADVTLADQQQDFQKEQAETLEAAIATRRAGQELQSLLNEQVGKLIEYVGAIVKAFQTDGFKGALSAISDPIVAALEGFAGSMKEEIKEGMREALSDVRILGRRLIQEQDSEAKALGDVRQPVPHTNPMLREIPL